MEVTKIFSRYLVNSRWADIPERVRHEAARALLNFMGCALGAARHGTVERALAAVREFAGPPQAGVLGRAERLDILNAALLNGISAHVLDFDDTHVRAIHPSAPVLPALLAYAEWRKVSGAELVHAFVLGVEAEEPHRAVGVPGALRGGLAHHRHGRRSSARRRRPASSLGLDEQQMDVGARHRRDAIGRAAAKCSAPMCKSLHPGRAAQNGLTAALLAARGLHQFGARASRRRAALRTCCRPKFDPKVITEGLGERFELLSNMYKPYACGLVVHAAIDGCITARARA